MTRSFRCIVALGAALTFTIGCVDIDPVQPPRSNPTPPAAEPQPTEPAYDRWGIRILRIGDTIPTAQIAGEGPAWSPDGARIAFVSARDGTYQIYVMNRDGSGITQLTRDLRLHSQLSWSPDGSRIAWIDDFKLKAMSLSGGYAMTLADTRPPMYAEFSFLLMGSWSPDGQQIAYIDERDGILHLASVDGAAPIALTTSSAPWAVDTPPAWSPDGTRIAFVSGTIGCLSYCSAISVVSAQGGEVTPLVGGEKQFDSSPAWSPDGSRIAYLGTPDTCPPETCGGATDFQVLHVMNADGTGRRQLTTGRTGTPAWSPDGRTVLVTIGGGVVAIPTDGGVARLLSRIGAGGALSPDRQWIAFTVPPLMP